MVEIKQEILDLDIYTKTLINTGTYKLYDLHNPSGRPFYALQKSENDFVLLDQGGYPINNVSSIDYPSKEQIVFKHIDSNSKYSFNSLF